MLLLLPVTHPLLDGLYELHQPPAITAPATPVATADKTPTTSPSPANQTTTSQTPTGNGSGGTPAGTTTPAQPVCVTTYARSKWQFVREERKAVEQRDLKWVHYERTVTDRCTGDSWTETKVEGPFDLWQSVPDSSITDVDHPDGAADGVSGSPLQSYSIPNLPNGVAEPSTTPLAAPKSVTSPSPKPPVFPSTALLVGAIVAAWEYRWRRRRRPGGKPEPDIPVGPQADLINLLAELKQKLQGVDPANASTLPPEVHDICSRIEQLISEHRSEIPEGFINDVLAGDSAVISQLVLYLKKEQLAFLKDNDLYPVDPQWGQDPVYKAYSFLWPVVDPDTQKAIIGLNADWTKRVQDYFTSLQAKRFELVMSTTPDPDEIWRIAEEEDKIGSTLKGKWAPEQQAAIDKRYKELAVQAGRLWAGMNNDPSKQTVANMKKAEELQKMLSFLAPYVSDKAALDAAVRDALTNTSSTGLTGLPKDRASALVWNVFQSSGVTEEQLIGLISATEHPNLYRILKDEGLAAAIIKADRDPEDPVNGLFILASLIHETGWGTADWFEGTRNTGSFMQNEQLMSFNSFEDSVEFGRDLLVNDYRDKGFTNTATIAQKYCPIGHNDAIDKDRSLFNPWWPGTIADLLVEFGGKLNGISQTADTAWAIQKTDQAAIKKVQDRLAAIWADPADNSNSGVWDQRTEAAVAQFQYFNDLPITGIVDAQTLVLLNGSGRFDPKNVTSVSGPNGSVTYVGPGFRRLPRSHGGVKGPELQNDEKVESVAVPTDFWLTLEDGGLKAPLASMAVTDHSGTRVAISTDKSQPTPTRSHSGTDYHAEVGTPVMAPYAGKVVAVSYNSWYGNFVVMEHHDALGTPFYTLYAHLSDVEEATKLQKSGSVVTTGTQIALSGNTGNVAAHLHFELYKAYGPSIGSDSAVPGWDCLDQFKVYASSEAFFGAK